MSILLSKSSWAARLYDRPVLFFVDNEGCRHSLIRGAARAGASSGLIRCCWDHDLSVRSFSWYARVPSAANIAYGPSRLDDALCLALGFVKVKPSFGGRQGDEMWQHLMDVLSVVL